MSKYGKMLEVNHKQSLEKIQRAKLTILEMIEEEDKVTVPKLMQKTGLSSNVPYIHDFNKIPSLVSINKYNKATLVELIDFFDSFPLLFNGERIKPT